MTFDKLIEVCHPLDIHGSRPDVFGSLTQDSRRVSKGSVFIAVRGTQVDGHLFIENAISRGASIVICEDSYYTEEADVCVLEVENTRLLVGPLAQAFEGYPARQLTVIGITGTNGKTTVATLIYQVLHALGAGPSLLGTAGKRIQDEMLDSLLTTSDPVELAEDMRRMVEADSRYLVMEVSSHALDQHRVEGLDFSIAAFTNLSHDHLDYHDSLDAYAASKKRLFDSLEPDAQAFVNGDDPNAGLMVKDCKAETTSFGFREKTDIPCTLLTSDSTGIRLEIDGTECRSPLIGSFNAYNVALAFLVCRALGFKENKIAKHLETAAGAPGRLERVAAEAGEGGPLVLIDYAHTPDALKNVLSTLNELKDRDQELIVVFGCGGNRDRAKRPAMAIAAEQYADRVVVTSDNPRNEDPDSIIDEIMVGFENPGAVTRITDREKAIETTIASAPDDAIVLVAGKGHETYQELKTGKQDFDDRKIARRILADVASNRNVKPGGGN